MNHKFIRCLLFLTVGLFATHTSAQQQSNAKSLVGTYQTGHRFGGSDLTLKADGIYVRQSSDCTMEYTESGIYVSSAAVLHFKTLKSVAKSHGGEREINLLDPNERKAIFGNYSGIM